jgi:hypothetical protein
MSTSTLKLPVISASTIEDYIPLVTLIISAADNAQLSTIVPGVPGFLLGVFIGGLSKALIGIAQSIQAGQKPTPEDILQAVITFLGAAGTLLSANPQFLIYGTVFGWLVKSLGFLQSGFNVEDGLLAAASLLTLAGTYFGVPAALAVGSFLMVISKTLPSIGTDGAAGNPNAATTPAPASA